jgi:hypothetical protein
LEAILDLIWCFCVCVRVCVRVEKETIEMPLGNL